MITIFLHIPRTAGTTLTDIMAQGQDVWRVSAGQLLGRELYGFDVMAGHVAYGIHGMLLRNKPYQYVTMLRDPVDRIASIYYFYRSRENWSKSNQIWKCMATYMPLREFAQQPYAELDNAMVRHVAGGMPVARWLLAEGRRVGEEDFMRAIENLETFAFVGLTERFEQSVKRLSGVMGWESIPEYGHSNPSMRPDALPEETVKAIRELNQFDQRLYDWAVDRYYDT